MTTKTSNTSQKALAAQLGVSQQRVSQLVKSGMPASLSAAKAWIRHKSEESKSAPEPGTLAEGRLRKVLLECRLLQAKIDRELDSSEMMPTSEVEKSLEIIMTMLGHSLTRGCEELAAGLEGRRIDEIYLTLKGSTHRTLVACLRSFISSTTIDPRLKRVAERVVEASFYC